MTQRIAIQGIKGSNHHKVVCDFISTKAEIKACMSFNNLVKAIITNQVDYGIMAIENSIAGSILPNYKLISDHDLNITAEYYLDIKHNLAALEGQKLDEIKTVNSHQMAFLQCGDFLYQQKHLKLVEDVDTALPAQIIAEKQISHVAAIVPDGTAELFGLEVLKSHIQDNDLNSTRFVKVERNSQILPNQSADKASIRFELAHEPGSLFKVLALLQEYNVNMTKIQSIPTAHSKWNYAFYIDLIFLPEIDIKKLMKTLKSITHHFKLLGIYKQAQK
ncbi:prephenate dehydratase [Mesohalobacter halotolerans]|uniref:prephenate dehydratase n=1 Tax=Mesohalobacter halotolerans TaxID=1883405 RepID=A0A4U5TQ88_9FLAO|nr:prephenate dehydratase domain-containing protein [Mesohalobacter halotolerans]MBS3738968.1 ACT domain-containing protein [Psychroflexus sp.]TKS56349.1 ACT domain-containing protein [Mesohalobacter halotolerans]